MSSHLRCTPSRRNLQAKIDVGSVLNGKGRGGTGLFPTAPSLGPNGQLGCRSVPFPSGSDNKAILRERADQFQTACCLP